MMTDIKKRRKISFASVCGKNLMCVIHRAKGLRPL